MRKFWTTVDERNLRAAWEGDKPIKASMHLFPGRSIYAVQLKAKKMGLDNRRSERSIKYDESLLLSIVRNALQSGGPATVNQLMERTGVSQSTAYKFIRLNHRGDEKRIHICRWIRNGPSARAAVYAWGEGDDVRASRAKTGADLWQVKKRRKELKADPSPFAVLIHQISGESQPQTTRRGRYEKEAA